MANTHEIRLSGSGTDGLLSAGKILGAAAVIYDDKFATQSQSYGPEARGNGCRSDVIISDSDISSPKANDISILLALTQEAVDRYSPELTKGGILIVDKERVDTIPKGDFIFHRFPMKECASKLGRPQSVNVIALAVIVGITNIVTREGLENAVLLHTPKGNEEINHRALEAGYALVAEMTRGDI